jgi:hypothetical protein
LGGNGHHVDSWLQLAIHRRKEAAAVDLKFKK